MPPQAPSPIRQLEDAIATRRELDDVGGITAHVISAVLTIGKTEPTQELDDAARDLDNHFNSQPDETNSRTGGTLELYASLIKRITDSAFKEGEHVE